MDMENSYREDNFFFSFRLLMFIALYWMLLRIYFYCNPYSDLEV